MTEGSCTFIWKHPSGEGYGNTTVQVHSIPPSQNGVLVAKKFPCVYSDLPYLLEIKYFKYLLPTGDSIDL